jgi:hypothetical protein
LEEGQCRQSCSSNTLYSISECSVSILFPSRTSYHGSPQWSILRENLGNMLSSNEGTFYKWQLKQIRTSVSILAWTHTGYKKAVPLPMPRIPIPTLEPQSPYFHTSYQVLQNRFVSWMRLEKCNTFNGILIRFQYNFTKPHKVVFLKMSLQYSLILMWFYQGICIDEILHIHTSQKVCVCVSIYTLHPLYLKKKKR